MKTIVTIEAVGMVLAHDHTRIVGNEFKGVQFKKGHIIKEEDVPILLNMGKNSIYVLELSQNTLHENKAAEELAKLIQGPYTSLAEASEGKVNIYSQINGILEINTELLFSLNILDHLAVSTLKNFTSVSEKELVCSAKIIPLVLPQEVIDKAKEICTSPIVSVSPLPQKKVGLVITGSEVFYKRIEDKFAPILRKKIEDLGSVVTHVLFAPDDKEVIKSHIKTLLPHCDIILSSGGMSVDPDDVSPLAIKEMSTHVVTYGTPVLPGAMFMLAYHNHIPLLGMPACGMFAKTTVLDVLLPLILLNKPITKEFIAHLGHGGLCRSCSSCHYPHCSFC